MMPRREKSTDLRPTGTHRAAVPDVTIKIGAELRGLTAKICAGYPVKGPAIDAASAASIQTSEGEMPLVSWPEYKVPAISVDYS